MTFNIVTILIKSVINKDKNHYYYNTNNCLEKMLVSISWNIITKSVLKSIIILRFEKVKVTKGTFYTARKPIKI